MDEYNKIQPHIQLEIKNALEVYSKQNEYILSKIPVHSHTGNDTVQVEYKNLKDKRMYIVKSLDGALPQTAANFGVIYINEFENAVVTSVSEVHQVAGTDAGSVTLNVEKLTSGQALGSGVNVLSSDLSLKSTKDIVQIGTLTSILVNKQLKKGDRLALKDTGTLTGLVGVCIIIEITY